MVQRLPAKQIENVDCKQKLKYCDKMSHIGDGVSLARWAKKRDTAEPAIVQALEAVGCRVWKLDRPFDLLVGRLGRFTVLEVKSNHRKPDKRQKAQTDELAAAKAGGLPVFVVRTPEEALEAVGATCKL